MKAFIVETLNHEWEETRKYIVFGDSMLDAMRYCKVTEELVRVIDADENEAYRLI